MCVWCKCWKWFNLKVHQWIHSISLKIHTLAVTCPHFMSASKVFNSTISYWNNEIDSSAMAKGSCCFCSCYSSFPIYSCRHLVRTKRRHTGTNKVYFIIHFLLTMKHDIDFIPLTVCFHGRAFRLGYYILIYSDVWKRAENGRWAVEERKK